MKHIVYKTAGETKNNNSSVFTLSMFGKTIN